jgi:hypothetical protein
MRIWSVHPEYLDTKGLVALWREGLLAKNVLEGRTKGYKNHPQLDRFNTTTDPVNSINQYLSAIYYEAKRRGFNFDNNKIKWDINPIQMTVTKGQLKFETIHLLKKLNLRDKMKYNELKNRKLLRPHPLFKMIDGGIEEWEKIKSSAYKH